MYDKTVLLEILLEDACRTLDNDGKPYKPFAVVYKTISDKMRERGSNISAKHVYVIMRENCNGYYKLLRHFNIVPAEKSNDISNNDFKNSFNSKNTSTSSSSTTLYSKEFNIVISAEKWQTIKKIYNNRACWVLQPGLML